MDEIVDIDTNHVLDMYVTLSRDGTIALRCMRTSQVYQHFLLMNKLENAQGDVEIATGFTKIFGQVYALKLSCHGYIIVVGQSLVQKLCRFIVYSLNGDLLKVVEEQRVEVKSVFLNTREDYLCVAANFTHPMTGQKQGWLRVLSLYGLNLVADLSDTIYNQALESLKIKSK